MGVGVGVGEREREKLGSRWARKRKRNMRTTQEELGAADEASRFRNGRWLIASFQILSGG